MHQPAEHLGRAISAVAHESCRIQIEALHRSFDHTLCRQDLGLADRGGRFDIDNNRVVDIDQIVGGVSKKGLSAMGSGPACRRIGRRDEFGCDLGCSSESSVVEYGQILLNGPACSFRRKPFPALDALLAVGVRLDQAGIDRKAFAANQTLRDAALQDHLKDAPQKIALAETAMPVLRKGGMIGDVAVESEPAEPPVRQIEVDLFAEAPFRADTEAVADDQYPDHQLGINRWSSQRAVEWRQVAAQL